MPSVLMVAYHFPPLAGSSGIQRTLRFVQHLPAFGWQPLVLSADPRAYERVSGDLDGDVPAGVPVCRAFALDTARHLSIGGRYIGAMARPDRWVSWRFDAMRQGMRLVRRHRPAVLWSTYPIATAHLIGARLARATGLPWVADFRDPMAQDGYPADPKTWQQYRDIEQAAMQQAALCVFTTPGAAAEYQRRYPAYAHKVRVIENGYDEETFAGAAALAAGGPLNPGCTTWLHSGIVYPSERDPTQLMQALRLLHDAGTITPGRFKLRFRAPVAEALLNNLAASHGVQVYVEVLPPVPYREALAEMLRADALLVLQASNCNQQIPAKLYEYLRSGRPIVALTDPDGDTAGVLRQAGIETLARLDMPAEIVALIRRMLSGRPVTVGMAERHWVSTASREARSKELARILDRVRLE
jgi:glycosyltransferase involved in cell wall biosynthesis